MKILLAGAAGQVGQAIVAAFQQYSQHQLIACTRAELDITDLAALHIAVHQYRPDMLINAAAYTAVDKAEQEPELAFAINALGAENLAKVCQALAIPFVHLSTDYVFDGIKTQAYVETDATNPQGVYGMSKWQGEQAIRALWPQHYIVRVSWVFGVHGHNFVKTMLRLAAERDELRVVADQYGAPTSAASIAACLGSMLPFIEQRQHCGTYHYTNQPVTTWYDFATEIIGQARARTPLKVQSLTAIASEDYPTPAKRPANSALNSDKIQQQFGVSSPAWQEELHTVLTTLYPTPL